jgi:LPS-assembly protein
VVLLRGLILTLALVIVGMGAPALAQSPDATLIADRIQSDRSGRLTAEGNVEIFYQGRRLKAARIVYNRDSDTVDLTGPITLTDGPDVVILADQAELTTDLRDGILRSARLVLDQQLQIAANEIHRVDGRYSQAIRTVASSCEVCADDPIPLWQIRASRIIHDEESQQLYFENAVVQIGRVPVFYVPRLRLPDPTLERARGLLVPSLRTTDRLGTGITTPYFFPLGRRADLTVLPTFTTNGSASMAARYRHAFRMGEIELTFAYANDEIVTDARGFGQLVGRFDLPRGFELTFDIEDVSDAGYYRDYGLPESDRIDSEIAVTRIRRDELIEARATYFTSFRVGENNQTIPRLQGQAEVIRRFTPDLLGGAAELRLTAFGYERPSGADVVGRDVSRLSFDGDWRRSTTTPGGFVFTAMTGVSADYYAIAQDSTAPANANRIMPRAAVELRLPLIQRGARATQVLEPVAQVVWSGDDPAAVPNEDSVLTEFDEANLFDLNRFTGRDRVEQGLRANLGLRWSRQAASGWKLGTTVGRVAAADPNPAFAQSSGFAGSLSDWLTSVRIDTPGGFKLITRTQTAPNFVVNKAAIRMGWQTEQVDLNGTYTWLRPDAAVGRPFETSELTLDTTYTFESDWKAGFDWQYDLTADSTRSAGVGIGYQNECVTFDLSLSRSFTASANVQPTTNFGLIVSLDGFGAKRSGRGGRRSCGG